MKQIIARLYITIITVLILLGMAFLFNEVRLSRNDYKFESRNVAKEVNDLVEQNWFKNKNFTNQNLNDELEGYMSNNPNLHSIIIYSRDEGLKVVSSRYRDRSFLLNSFTADDPNWNSSPEYGFNWWDRRENNKITSPLQISKNGYFVDIVYNVLSKEKIQEVLKDAITVIIILFLLTIVVIILFSSWKNKYSVKEYDDDLFKPLGSSSEEEAKTSVIKESYVDDLGDLGDLDDIESSISDSLDDDLEDFALEPKDDLDEFGFDEPGELPDDSDNLDGLEDFDLDFEEPGTPQESKDSINDLEDFDIGIDEADELEDFDIKTDDSEELEDFDLDFEEPVETPEDSLDEIDELEDLNLESDNQETEVSDEVEELEDFSLEFDEPEDSVEALDEMDELDDFSLEFDEPEEEKTETVDELDDFKLDIEEQSSESELEDFSLDIEEESTETLDEVDDFTLDMDGDEIDELKDFDLEIEDIDENLEESQTEDSEEEESLEDNEETEIEDIDDVSLDLEEPEDELEKTIEEIEGLEEFDLDETEEVEEDQIEVDLKETDEVENELDELADLDIVEEDLDLMAEELDDGEPTDYNLEDFAIDSEEKSEGYDLDEFSLDSPEGTYVDSEGEETVESPESTDEIEDMDLSPETIEASTDIDELPNMEIEEEIVHPKSDFKNREDAGPELSSLLEKAGVAENDLSVAVFNINGADLKEHYDFIKSYFDSNDNIYELSSNQIAVALNDIDNNGAISEINDLLSSAKDKGLSLTAGISSMSGRLVGENRLMGEAISALAKADDLSKEMLAFRPDPNKYKEFIKNS